MDAVEAVDEVGRVDLFEHLERGVVTRLELVGVGDQPGFLLRPSTGRSTLMLLAQPLEPPNEVFGFCPIQRAERFVQAGLASVRGLLKVFSSLHSHPIDAFTIVARVIQMGRPPR